MLCFTGVCFGQKINVWYTICAGKYKIIKLSFENSRKEKKYRKREKQIMRSLL
jgi:hypothetical protein